MSQESLAIRRLKQDFIRLQKDPVPLVTATPLPRNIFEWHFIIMGPEQTPYSGGIYHGKLVFPSEFPFKPPSIYLITPNGRFRPNTRLCLSISDYHPDTWNPAWSVATILTGLISFMVENKPTTGSIETSQYEKIKLARKSLEFNLKNPTFRELFPELVKELLSQKKQEEEAASSNGSCPSLNASIGEEANGHGDTPGGGGADQPVLGATLTNLMVILGFAAFAFTVQCVLKSIAS